MTSRCFLYDELCNSPNLLINPSACRFERKHQNQRICNKLWLIWIKEVVIFLNESSMISNSIDFIWEIAIIIEFLKLIVSYVVIVKEIAFINFNSISFIPRLLLLLGHSFLYTATTWLSILWLRYFIFKLLSIIK